MNQKWRAIQPFFRCRKADLSLDKSNSVSCGVSQHWGAVSFIWSPVLRSGMDNKMAIIKTLPPADFPLSSGSWLHGQDLTIHHYSFRGLYACWHHHVIVFFTAINILNSNNSISNRRKLTFIGKYIQWNDWLQHALQGAERIILLPKKIPLSKWTKTCVYPPSAPTQFPAIAPTQTPQFLTAAWCVLQVSFSEGGPGSNSTGSEVASMSSQLPDTPNSMVSSPIEAWTDVAWTDWTEHTALFIPPPQLHQTTPWLYFDTVKTIMGFLPHLFLRPSIRDRRMRHHGRCCTFTPGNNCQNEKTWTWLHQ